MTNKLAIFAFLLVCNGLHAEQVTVETTECNGATGFNSFDERRLFKIQPGPCANPNRPGEMLQQILLHSSSGVSRYDVMWVTAAEARSAMDQIRANRAARRDRIKGRNQVVIVNTPAAASASAPQKQSQDATQGPKRHEEQAQDPGDSSARLRSPANAPPPTLKIIEPPLSTSSERFLTDQKNPDRLIVGRVNAAAGVMALSINGKPVNVDENGLFKETIRLSGDKTPIDIVAIDTNGKRASRHIDLVALHEERGSSRTTTTAETTSSSSEFGGYHALLIGINDYAHYPDLRNAKPDVLAIDEILRTKYGFTTHVLINPSRYEILTAVSDLRRSLTEKDNLLIYYAGHGEYDPVNLRGHWLPADAEPDSPANWISTLDITDSVNRMSAKHVLVVADSCYSGALNRSAISDLDPGLSESARTAWLRVMAEAKSRTVLTSGGLNPVSDGGGGQHSIFAAAFIDTLKSNTSALEGTRLYHEIRRKVATKAERIGLDQVPEYAAIKGSDHEFGEFLLVANQP